ncbi:MAG: glycosyltransferase [Chitinophagales bacterium]
MFSILIPSWNNLEFLKICIESILKNSSYSHQIIIHINEGTDGTAEWVKQMGLDFSFTVKNEGVCIALNQAAMLANHKYLVFINDDMYALPAWDQFLTDEIETLNTDCFMLSSTLIEPYETKNNCVIVADYGRGVRDFDEEKLLKEFSFFIKQNWSGSTWPPFVVHKKWWDMVDGFSEEFSPGMSADDDFAMKMWQKGCRNFKGAGASRVYHFVSKSIIRMQNHNYGRKQFLKKWGIKQTAFHKYYTLRGEEYKGELHGPGLNPGYLLQRVIGTILRLS